MEIVLIIFILCLIKLSKKNTSFSRTTSSALYNLLTFDTFGNALKLTSKNRATSNIFDNSFSEQNPKIFYYRKQALVDDILMRSYLNHDLLFILVMIF
jgi:hypothetical protein